MTTHRQNTVRFSEEFTHSGYLILTGMFRTEVAAAKQQFLESGSRGSGSTIQMFDWAALPESLKSLCQNRELHSIVSSLLGQQAAFMSAKVVMKSGQKRFAIPWHQDHVYWKGNHKVSSWIAMDQSTRSNGCLKLIPGSHDTERVHTTRESGITRCIEDTELPDTEPVYIEMEPGDVVIFHDLLVHGSSVNTDDQERCAFVPTWCRSS